MQDPVVTTMFAHQNSEKCSRKPQVIWSATKSSAIVRSAVFILCLVVLIVTGCLTSRRSQPPLALSVPLSRFASQVGGGSASCVRLHGTL